MTAERARGYLPALDGVRALAFLLVFGAHALPGYSFFIPATLGVTLFFFLSGYLITTLLRRELEATGTLSLRRFYLRRTLRIFVPLYLVYALAAGFAHFVQHESMGNRLGCFALIFYWYNYATALGLRAWVPLGLNVVWSLSVEEHFYLLFPPLLLWLTRRKVASRTLARGIVLFCAVELLWRVALVTVLHQHNFWTYYATDARMDSILFGALLALTHNPVLEDRPLLHRGKDTFWLVTALLVLVGSLVPRSYVYRETLRYTLQGLALMVVFHFLLTPANGRFVRWLEWRPLRYLGWISYVLYLSHEFILDSLSAVLPGGLPHRMWVIAALGFALAIGFASLFRYAVEVPLQRWRSRL